MSRSSQLAPPSPKPEANAPVNSSQALLDIAGRDVDGVLKLFDTSIKGLSETEAARRLKKSGLNEMAREKPRKWYIQLLKTVTNPLSLLFIVLALSPTMPLSMRAI